MTRVMTKWIQDPNADYPNHPEELAKLLVAEMTDFHNEMKEYDPNDGFYDYLMGLISARCVIVGRLGFDEYIPDEIKGVD